MEQLRLSKVFGPRTSRHSPVAIAWRAVLLAAAGLFAGAAYAQGSLADGGKVHPPYHGLVPARSEVVFSTRFKQPEAPALIKAFGATRIDGVYPTDKAFAGLLKEQAPWFGGTLNANGPLPTEASLARDFDGHIVTAPCNEKKRVRPLKNS